MKKVSLLIVAVLLSIASWSQSYESLMEEKVQLFEQRDKHVDLVSLSDDFASISKQFKQEEGAKYYRALCLVLSIFHEKDNKQKDVLAQKSEKLINKGIKLNPNNAEWHLLKALMYQAAITASPRERGYVYSQKAKVCLAEAFKLDSNNPRYFFLKGQNIYYTPKQFGGGASKAKPLFEKAALLFEKQNAQHSYSIRWGKNTNAQQLKACK